MTYPARPPKARRTIEPSHIWYWEKAPALRADLWNARKNYDALLRAFDRGDARDAALVIVGRQGWMSEVFLAGLEQHPKFGKQIFWYTSVEDGALLSLYRGAYGTVLPSHYEGYGLPAVEALTQGYPTIVSDAGSNTAAWPLVTSGKSAQTQKRCYLFSTASIPKLPFGPSFAPVRPHSSRSPGGKRGLV